MVRPDTGSSFGSAFPVSPRDVRSQAIDSSEDKIAFPARRNSLASDQPQSGGHGVWDRGASPGCNQNWGAEPRSGETGRLQPPLPKPHRASGLSSRAKPRDLRSPIRSWRPRIPETRPNPVWGQKQKSQTGGLSACLTLNTVYHI